MSMNPTSPGADASQALADHHGQALSEFQTLPATGTIQFDRFCDHCGYNLRGQPTRRELRTRLILLACPECGMFHPANETTPMARLWTRLRQIITVAWVAFWIAVWFIASLMYFIPTLILADEARRWANGYSGWNSARSIEYILMFGVSLGFVVAAGALFVMLAVIAFPHWHRLAFVVLSCVWVAPAMALVMLIQASMSYVSESIAVRCGIVLATAAVAIAAGLVATLVARPIARLVIALLLPVAWRAHVAHLWIVDGLTPPGMREPPPVTTR